MDNLFTFHGVDHKVGTTMVSQSVAEMIAAANKDLQVLFISLNGREGTEYVQEVGESIERIKLYIDNKVLNVSELMQACRQKDNFYMLGGVTTVTEERYYFPHTAIYLLKTVRDDFDLIIADSGNSVDNGLAMGALEQARERYLIVTQQESSLKRYEKLKPLYNRLNIQFDGYIVNKYFDEDPYDMSYIEKRLSISKQKMRKVQEANSGRRAEMDYRTLISYRNDRYIEDIIHVSNGILSKLNAEKIDCQGQRKNRWKGFR